MNFILQKGMNLLGHLFDKSFYYLRIIHQWVRSQIIHRYHNSFNSYQKFKLWLSFKLLFNRQILFGGSAPLSFLGLVLGVSALVASMSVMRGFEHSLKKAMVDVTSDVQVIRKGKLIDSWDEFSSEIKKIDPSIISLARFAYTEAVFAFKGKVTGVLIQGLVMDEIQSTLKIKDRIESGRLIEKENEILIGKGLAIKNKISINDEVYLAVSLSSPFESKKFKRQAMNYKVVGIIDFGKNEWNERLIVSELSDFQNLTQIGQRYTGAMIKLNNSDMAVSVSNKISEKLGPNYYAVLNWYEMNRNLFEAVKLESAVIFVLVFLIVVVAAFNISSTLYVLIRQRYKDISILKTLGASKKFILNLFVWQGFFIGTVGVLSGFVLGFFLSKGFMILQLFFPVISGAVYKIDRIDTFIEWTDLILIYIVTVITCMAAAYPPALKGAKLTVVDGLLKD